MIIMDDTLVVIPCAGIGSRMGLPYAKELINLKDDSFFPVIESCINEVIHSGLKRICFIINHNKTDLLKFLGDGNRYGLKFSYVIQESPMSLPHALQKATKNYEKCNILFLMPDSVYKPKGAVSYFIENVDLSAIVNLGLFRTNNPQKFAMVDFSKDNIVTFAEEKNPMSKLEWMWGMVFWNKEFTDHLNSLNLEFRLENGREQTLSQVMGVFISNKEVHAVKLINYNYYDLGTWDDYRLYKQNYNS